jgi:hypothetical protein
MQLCGIVNELNLTGFAAEIGTAKGMFSDMLLSQTDLSCLFSVDVWDGNFPSYCSVKHTMEDAANALKVHGDRSIMIKANSLDVVKHFPDDHFDLLFIDNNHSYDHVKKELGLYWSKLKVGGIFSGDDYIEGVRTQKGFRLFGVVEAVDEFVESQDQKLNLIEDIWWLIKTQPIKHL